MQQFMTRVWHSVAVATEMFLMGPLKSGSCLKVKHQFTVNCAHKLAFQMQFLPSKFKVNAFLRSRIFILLCYFVIRSLLLTQYSLLKKCSVVIFNFLKIKCQ